MHAVQKSAARNSAAPRRRLTVAMKAIDSFTVQAALQTRLEAQDIYDQAAGSQALKEQGVGLVLARPQQLKLTHGRELQAHLQR